MRTTMTKKKICWKDFARMKVASAWLTVLPLKLEGFFLNKREFFDALALRYWWQVRGLSFKLIRSQVACIRGSRSLKSEIKVLVSSIAEWTMFSTRLFIFIQNVKKILFIFFIVLLFFYMFILFNNYVDKKNYKHN